MGDSRRVPSGARLTVWSKCCTAAYAFTHVVVAPHVHPAAEPPLTGSWMLHVAVAGAYSFGNIFCDLREPLTSRLRSLPQRLLLWLLLTPPESASSSTDGYLGNPRRSSSAGRFLGNLRRRPLC